jgi:peptide/nickel transport system substrate-binding protein
MIDLVRRTIAGALAVVAVAAWDTPGAAEPRHAIAMIGDPALPSGFPHLPYVNPDAPKGGKISYGVFGGFDSVNPLNSKGNAARGFQDGVFGNLVFESLLMRSADEPFTLYAFLAESVETPPDRGWVEFTIDPRARFSDGTPVTPEDVIFSQELLRDRGRGNMRTYYKLVERSEKIGERGVRFHFENSKDRELPLILGLMPILPKHAVDPETFEKTSLTPLIGTGPYLAAEITPPSRTLFRRNPTYWAKDLPIKRGLDNYDEISIEYFRDVNTMFEAFKKGLYDVYPDGDPSHWQAAYDFPAVRDGRVVRDTFRSATPKGMSGFVFNTRRPLFMDIRVRRALASLLDADWVNQNLYYGTFVRAAGYFNDSELSSVGRPADERERALLAPFPGAVDPAVMDGTYRPASPGNDARGRAVYRAALQDLEAAGWHLNGNRLLNDAGQQFSFEILVTTLEDERIALVYQRSLAKLGIATDIRRADSSLYEKRRFSYDFDMIRFTWSASLSPGNEQKFRWSSEVARTDGMYNYPGAAEPAIDAMIAALLAAPTRDDFVSAVRALDRVLISGTYVVPLFYLPEQWVARWTHIEHPRKAPLTGYSLPTWWAKP